MSYQKYLIVAGKKDLAGINITTQLSQFRENPVLSGMKNMPSFDFYLIDTEIVDDNGINQDKINHLNNYGCVKAFEGECAVYETVFIGFKPEDIDEWSDISSTYISVRVDYVYRNPKTDFVKVLQLEEE